MFGASSFASISFGGFAVVFTGESVAIRAVVSSTPLRVDSAQVFGVPLTDP